MNGAKPRLNGDFSRLSGTGFHPRRGVDNDRPSLDIDRSSRRDDRLAVNTLFRSPQTHTLFGI
jgi:hypothetical protein